MWPFARRPPALPAQAGPAQDVARAGISPAVVEDIWDLLIDDFRKSRTRPSVRDLEDVYKESELVQSVLKEIVQAVSTCEVTAGLAVSTLLEHPNPAQDFAQFMAQLIVTYICTGAFYVLKLPIGSQAVQELHLLRTSGLTIEKGGFEAPYRAIRYSDGYNTYKNLDPDHLIKRVDPSPIAALDPASPIAACWDSVQLDLARLRFQRAALLRMPYMVGVVETTEGNTKPQRDMLQTSLQTIIGGQTLVLPKGAKMTTPGLERESVTLPGLAQQTESRVCAACNVPPILVGLQAGLEKSTYANFEEARKSYRAETIAPILTQLSDAFTRGLGEEVEFALPEPPVTPPEETSDVAVPETATI